MKLRRTPPVYARRRPSASARANGALAAAAGLAVCCALGGCASAPKYRAALRVDSAKASSAGPDETTQPLPVTIASPVKRWACSRITSRFGPRSRGGRVHEGIDIKTESGEEVLAAAAGIVSYAGRRSGYGTLIVIDHGNEVTTRYGHLFALTVRRGERVGAGESIGRAGKRGRASGTHLHFEIRRAGRPIDPEPHLCLDSAVRSP